MTADEALEIVRNTRLSSDLAPNDRRAAQDAFARLGRELGRLVEIEQAARALLSGQDDEANGPRLARALLADPEED